MSDIFISYTKSDRAKALTLARALEQEGWSVWWDPKIPPGKTFDEVIEDALNTAKCVIVLWSKRSVSSEWVRTEASAGKDRGVLIPALIEDDVTIPLPFRRLHASRLMDWRAEQGGHLEFEALKTAVAQLLDRSPSDVKGTSSSSPGATAVPKESARTPPSEKPSEDIHLDPERAQSQRTKEQRRSRVKWGWFRSMLVVLIVLDLSALIWYGWAISVEDFDKWKRVGTAVAGLFASLLSYFGIRLTAHKRDSAAQILALKPLQLSIVALTVIIWAFVLPSHNVTYRISDAQTGDPLAMVTVKVNSEPESRPKSDGSGIGKIRGLLARAHQVRFEKDGYQAESMVLSYADVLSRATLNVPLKPAPGEIHVTTHPPGASIYVDGTPDSIGLSPKAFRLPRGNHKLTLKLDRHLPRTEEIEVPGPKYEWKLTPIPISVPKTYPLMVSSKPTGAEIYVDGKFMGRAYINTKIWLEKGEHNIVLRLTDHEPHRERVIIPDDKIIAPPELRLSSVGPRQD